jgi:hypothetical protein
MPMIARPANGAEFWVVVDTDTGRLIAQGRPALCKAVAAGRPVIGEQGSLWQ